MKTRMAVEISLLFLLTLGIVALPVEKDYCRLNPSYD